MLNTILVMIGGAIGAALRYQFGRVSVRVMGTDYPWGTLGVNVIGGFTMGVVAGWFAMRHQGAHGEQLRLLVAVGILGGFTTFSAFSLETVLMLERGEWGSALSYILGSVLMSIGALALGLMIMRSATA